MDLTSIIGLAVAVFGIGGGAVLFYRWERERRKALAHRTAAEAKLALAEAGKADASASEIEIKTLRALWGQVAQLLGRMKILERRVAVLERENRGLRQTIDEFRNLVRRLWTVVRDNDLDADRGLAVAVAQALEDSVA